MEAASVVAPAFALAPVWGIFTTNLTPAAPAFLDFTHDADYGCRFQIWLLIPLETGTNGTNYNAWQDSKRWGFNSSAHLPRRLLENMIQSTKLISQTFSHLVMPLFQRLVCILKTSTTPIFHRCGVLSFARRIEGPSQPASQPAISPSPSPAFPNFSYNKSKGSGHLLNRIPYTVPSSSLLVFNPRGADSSSRGGPKITGGCCEITEYSIDRPGPEKVGGASLVLFPLVHAQCSSPSHMNRHIFGI